MRTVRQLSEVFDLAGSDLGVSDWLTIDQARIDRFAEASGDQQWIHVDPERAASGPFGTTIAHGYLTLALVVPLLWQLVTFPEESMTVNYGLNKVRFPAPVPVGGRVRLRAAVDSVAEGPRGADIVFSLTVELDGSSKPACVAKAVYRHIVG
jgi:acyl dehydratase